MFDFSDKREERMRQEWYAPIGEYILLFSNLEFELSAWIDLLANTNSDAIKDRVKGLQFSRRIDLILALIAEDQASDETKNKWKAAWKQAGALVGIRNLLCHNPPINNFAISFDEDAGEVSIQLRATELFNLRKPVGDPGCGLALTEIQEKSAKLRQLLILLDSLHTEEILRQ